MTHCTVWFFKKFYTELVFSTTWMRLGIVIRKHPTVWGITLGLLLVAVTIGVTYQARERRGSGGDRRKERTHFKAVA